MTSVEALADEELRLRVPGDTRDTRRVYVPIIVTTARLWMCRYDPGKIDIASGRVDEAQFEEVQTIRFKKALSSPATLEPEASQEMPYRRLRQVSRLQERTVFVVNSSAFVSLLESWLRGITIIDGAVITVIDGP